MSAFSVLLQCMWFGGCALDEQHCEGVFIKQSTFQHMLLLYPTAELINLNTSKNTSKKKNTSKDVTCTHLKPTTEVYTDLYHCKRLYCLTGVAEAKVKTNPSDLAWF